MKDQESAVAPSGRGEPGQPPTASLRAALEGLPERGWVETFIQVEDWRAALEQAASALEEAAQLARNPYGDAVAALGTDEPFAVGEKIAAAILNLKEKYS